MSRLLRPIGYHYDRCFRTHPAATLAIANAFCSLSGDAAAQLIAIWNSDSPQFLHTIDYGRMLRYFLFGLNMGPINGKWNECLEWLFTKSTKSHSPHIPEKSIELVEINTSTSIGPSVPTQSDSTSDSSKSHQPKLLSIIKMVTADQLIMAPFSLMFFICFMGLTEGSSWTEISNRIERLFFKLLIANWQVWPIIQLVNFKFMPLRLRVPFSAGCGILWTIFLSYASA